MVARTAVTVLWVVAITNAFNLIDGVDGLGCWVCLVFNDGCARSGTHQPVRGGFCNGGALAGAIVGFLRCNFNPATILLGDCGSVFTGFMLSALALQGAQKAPTIIAVAIPVVSCGLPILEPALSVMRCFISGRPVFIADREHIHP